METFQLLWPIISAGLAIPLGQWIKSKLPTDFPLQSVFIIACLNLGIVTLLWRIFCPAVPFVQMIPYALGGQVLSQAGHATIKTVQNGKNV